MNFYRGFSFIEYFFLISFLLIYGIYFVRIYLASRRLKTSATKSLFKFLIRAVYLGLISMALLGPNFGISETEARAAGKDIFLTFDLSASMDAVDVQPSRLDRAKSEILNLIGLFELDRMGLVVFNSDAYVFVPLTYDFENVKTSVKSLNTSLLGPGSTDFTPTFELLTEKLSSGSRNRAKVAVIVSDGEAHFNTSPSVLKRMKEENITLIFYGVGTLGGSKIPVDDGFKKDKNGVEVISYLDVKKINEATQETGGKYFFLNNQDNDISDLVRVITEIPASIDDGAQKSVIYNKFIFFLLLALPFVCLDFLVNINVLKV